jgi:uncharacterized protein YutE (UPF0331/DUF86 family)
MQNDVILNKLESLRRCIIRVEEKTPGDVTELIDDLDRQDIIVLNLERAIQLCVDIGLQIIGEKSLPVPDTMAGTFRVLAKEEVLDATNAEHLARAVGFRNIAVHAYQAIDWNIVFKISTKHLADFRLFAQRILAYIE